MKKWLVWIGLVAIVWSVSLEAAASLPVPPPTCTVRWNQEIPRGGVLHGDPDYGVLADDLLPLVRSVRVTWEDGTEVAGSLDVLWIGGGGGGFGSSFVWRPDAPLGRTGALQIELELDATDNDCIAENQRPSATAMVVDDPTVAFEPPQPEPLTGVIDLLDLVCCDGAMPSAPSRDYNVRAEEITWEEGHCVVMGPLAPGEAKLSFPDAPDIDELHRSHWVAQIVDGEELLAAEFVGHEMWFAFDRQLSAQLQFVDLASGEVRVAEQRVAVPGNVPLDVVPEDEILTTMDAECEGTPYVCGVPLDEVMTWSDDSCSPFEVDDEAPLEVPAATKSCSCRTDAPLPWPLLAFVPVLLRRRTRCRRRPI